MIVKLKAAFFSLRRHVARLWPAWLAILAGVAVFQSATLLSAVFRLLIAGIALLAAHVAWKALFGHYDFSAALENFNAHARDADGQAATVSLVAEAIVILGFALMRGLIYAAVILGVLISLGGP